MISAWIEAKGGIKRYSHGERPAGSKVPVISAWGHKAKNSAEAQAAKDGEE